MSKGEDGWSDKVEWTISVPGETPESLAPEYDVVKRLYKEVQGLIVKMAIWGFFKKAWNIGMNEPKKFIHCLKVGMALSLVSLFYYMRPLYEGVGGNAMWAVMTVVVVFEYTVGATLSKSLNRITATFVAGSLGIGVHWIASQCGEKFEPVILQTSVFLLAAAATFSRFIPSFKARFDYGALIFILTFSLVSISGYRVEKLLELARNRLSTISIGASICILTSMLICPIWAGNELHSLTSRNLEKLADSLDGCIAEYFKDNQSEENFSEKSQSYKSVLNSKAIEESMANFARWEPAHGRFNFRHPWKQYLKIGASMRSCAYCIETLSGCINSEVQIPELLKKHFRNVCMRLSSYSSNVLKELSLTMKTMTESTKTELSVAEMNSAVRDLQNEMKALLDQLVLLPSPTMKNEMSETCKEEVIENPQTVPLMDIFPVATVASMLVEIAARIESIGEEMNELAKQAKFKVVDEKKTKENKPSTYNQDHNTLTKFQMV